MEFAHARSLSPQTQQLLRQRAVASVVEQGRAQQRYRARGEPALAARKQGRPPHPNQDRAQMAETTQLLGEYAPEQLGLPRCGPGKR